MTRISAASILLAWTLLLGPPLPALQAQDAQPGVLSSADNGGALAPHEASASGYGDPIGSNTGDWSDVRSGPGTRLGDPGTMGWANRANEPLAEELANSVGQNRTAINFIWALVCAFLVFFMQAGFALLACGLSRAKNALQVFATNFVMLPISAFGYWLAGFAVMFSGLKSPPESFGRVAEEWGSGSGLFGLRGLALAGGDYYHVGVFTWFLFQVVFASTMAIIPTGALAERWRFRSVLLYGLFAPLFLYPIFGRWMWGGGFLSTLPYGHGAVDFAGSGVVHVVGGFSALAGALILGPRAGWRKREENREFRPHNLPMTLLGVMILAFGWFGFNTGSTLSASGAGALRIGVIATNTLLGGVGGSLAALFYMWVFWFVTWLVDRENVPRTWVDPVLCGNGMLGGLVAITAGCAFVPAWAAVVIGIISGILVCAFTKLIGWLGIDDPAGAFPVHGVGGAWGLLAVGLFADGFGGIGFNDVSGGVLGLFMGDTKGQWLAQLIALGVGAGWSLTGSLLFFGALKSWSLASLRDQELGLDLTEMGSPAYSDRNPQQVPQVAP